MRPQTHHVALVSAIAALVCGVSSKELHGRYLTISDLHPDWHYRYGADISQACHRGKDVQVQSGAEQDVVGQATEKAGYWGSPVTDCDTPATLIDATMHELEVKWKDKLDFIIIMGDLASSNIPRTMQEISSLNRNISSRFQAIFPNVPIIPSVGNNDVFPHNIMTGGPSKVLAGLSDVWADFIPEEQYHTFARGGYYSKEVISDKLVVVALNTIFWFDSNKILDGCPATKRHRPSDPGTEQLDWLSVSLSRWRSRGMQVILTGHVPPSDYYPDCYTRFAEISLAYQDTIVATIFGHKNVDYFSYFSHTQLFSETSASDAETPTEISALLNADTLSSELHSSYSDLPGQPKDADYVFFNIAPSIIPTYLPGYRIWSYNTTGTPYVPAASSGIVSDDLTTASYEFGVEIGEDLVEEQLNSTQLLPRDSLLIQTDASQSYSSLGTTAQEISESRKKTRKHKKHKRKHQKKHPQMPRYTSPDSPSRTNRFLTTLGYTQYILDLKQANKHHGYGSKGKESDVHRPWPEFHVEYTTFAGSEEEQRRGASGKTTAELYPYGLSDLTITSWLQLAHRLVHDKHAWTGFEKRTGRIAFSNLSVAAGWAVRSRTHVQERISYLETLTFQAQCKHTGPTGFISPAKNGNFQDIEKQKTSVLA